TLCRQGEANVGLLWLAEALSLVPTELDDLDAPIRAQAEDLQTLLRAQLALWSVQAAPLQLALAHPNGVTALAFGPEGKTIYTGCADGKVRRWDAKTGRLLNEVAALGKAVGRISHSTDGKILFAFNEKEGRFIDATNGETLAQKRGIFPAWALTESLHLI